MINFEHAEQILPTVWRLPDFFADVNSVRNSYRSPEQSWKTQYPGRLLTPWATNSTIDSVLAACVAPITQLTGHAVQPQVAYASLDLSGNKIMMHRLHTDIRCFLQVCMAQESALEMSSVFCSNATVNSTHPVDYEDISFFQPSELIQVPYNPNDAWLMLNHPRTFFGTGVPVAPNAVRETLCFHFAAVLNTST